jgi:acid phosphatase family membrane protein YuiD
MISIYFITPLITWLSCGLIKFFINSIKFRKFAFQEIGYGGMPSNHSAIVCSMVGLIFFEKGSLDPTFGVALTLAFIVLLDANNLRGEIGKHAKILNKLQPSSVDKILVREQIGHTYYEILVGAIFGVIISYCIYKFYPN